MEILLSIIFGAIVGAGGLLCWQRRKAKSPAEPGVTIQGGGGPGEEQGGK